VTGGQPQFLFPANASFGAGNLILHARSRHHTVSDFAGPLSIKTVMDGEVSWKVGGRDLVVDHGSFLVLGEGERYSMAIDAPRMVETACAFFRSGFVEEIALDATTSVHSALENPDREAPALPWISRLHRDSGHGPLHRVQTMARRCGGQLLPSGFEEDFLLLANDLLLLYREASARMARIPAVRAATRKELFRRVEAGREYLHAQAESAVSLDSAGRAACLSRYHFHRAFTLVTGQTPHAYLTELRLGRAMAMLRSGFGVTDACMKVGFTSVPSFSRLFRQRYGLPPSKVSGRLSTGTPEVRTELSEASG
jgi:AraC-like DNA-binding protein